jgi:hypothetical protein
VIGAAHDRKEYLMPSRLRTLLLSFATLVLAVSSAAPALAASGPASPLVRYDSSTWSLVPTTNQTRSILNGVSCVSATDCTAVGSVGNAPETLVESWNGTAWSVVPSPDPGSGDNNLYGVSCASATACTAVGVSIQKVTGGGRTSKTLVESWNGTAWSVVPSPNPGSGDNNLFGVSCVSATDCTAVGQGSSDGAETTLVESWNGTAWSVVPSANEGSGENGLNGVSCVSATACTAVGLYDNTQDLPRTLVESWNGTAWSVEPSPNKGSGENYLTGVSCVSATDCTAVGTRDKDRNRTLAESWDGTAWSVVPSPDKGSGDFLTGVSCASATVCTAVGRYFPTSHGDGLRTLVESWNGTAWSAVPTPNKVTGPNRNYLNGVSCDLATACNTVGYYQKVNKGDKSLAESNDVAPSAR